MRIIKFILRNFGYLYRRYKASFYLESYICMLVGITIIILISEDYIWKIKEIIIPNIITYPFTRFFYYSCKEYLIGNVSWNGFIVKYIFKFFVFSIIWTFSFIPGICCIIYILMNENAKEYNRRKTLRNTDYF